MKRLSTGLRATALPVLLCIFGWNAAAGSAGAAEILL